MKNQTIITYKLMNFTDDSRPIKTFRWTNYFRFWMFKNHIDI